MSEVNESTEVAMNEPQETKVEEQFTKAELKKFADLDKKIEKEMSSVEKSYLTVANAVFQIYDGNLFKIAGFKNIYEFSAQKYSIARGTANNFINVIKAFGEVTATGEYTGQLLPQYSEFSFSKLQVMLTLPAETLIDCKPDMTVKQLKALKDSVNIDDLAPDTEGGEGEGTSDSEPKDTDKTGMLVKLPLEYNDVNYLLILVSRDNNGEFSHLKKHLEKLINKFN